jgi:TIR domain
MFDMDSVKVFISWAGEASRQVGEALHQWLPMLFEGVTPWISAHDLDKGRQWQHEIMENLRTSRFGIVCLTPDNLTRPWMLFEAGAISTLSEACVFTFLHGVEYAQVTDPLSMFNHTASRRDDVRRMVTSLNNVLDTQKVLDGVLAARFEKFWPDIEGQLNQVQMNHPPEEIAAPRDQGAIMSEVLTLVRDTSRSLAAVSARRPQVEPENRPIRSIVMSRFSTKLRELGVPCQQMGMPVEAPGGITMRLNDREIEVSIGDAADFVDGILKPVDFLKRIGI